MQCIRQSACLAQAITASASAYVLDTPQLKNAGLSWQMLDALDVRGKKQAFANVLDWHMTRDAGAWALGKVQHQIFARVFRIVS